MSYFESYLFQKRTGQLTQNQKNAVQSLSSRAEVSSTDAYFEYNYGSFSGDPLDILARYFDALRFYIPHYGGRLAYRFDPRFVDVKKLQSFEVKNHITVSEIRDSIVIDINLCNDGDYHETETEFYEKDNLFAKFHDDTLNRDYRWLEILWCFAMNQQHHPDHSQSIRPTLTHQKMSPRHHLLTDFFYESTDTINVIEQLTYRTEVDDFDPDEWIDHISINDMRPIIKQLLFDPHFAHQELLTNLRKTSEEAGCPAELAPSITHQAINDLIDIARKQREAAEQKDIAQEAEKFTRKVIRLETSLWDRAHTLIGEKKSASYQLAIQIMHGIKFAYLHEQQEEAFLERAKAIRCQYSRCTSLKTEMDQYNLCTKTIQPEETNEFSYLGDRDPHSQPKLNWGIFDT
jgi:hypothetical protein